MKLKEIVKDSLNRHQRVVDRKPKADFICSCVAGALIDTCVDWIVDDRGMEQEEVIRIIADFLKGGVKAIL